VSAQFKEAKKRFNQWENQSKIRLDSIQALSERTKTLTSEIETCQAKEKAQRSEIDTMTTTITGKYAKRSY